MIRSGRGEELVSAHRELCNALKNRDVSHLSEVVQGSYFGEILQNGETS